MNVGLTTFKDNILIHGTEADIYHNSFIRTIEEYDIAIACARKYLTSEGFLDDQILSIINVIDATGNQVIREECL
jgi:hypothetical protein